MASKRFPGLSFELAKAWFKLKNEGSYLGILWYLLNPLLMFLIIVLLFNNQLGNNIQKYPIYVLLGIIMFNFFQSTTQESTKIVNEHRWLIKSINFPRTSLIKAVVLKNLFSHFFEIILFLVILIILGINPLPLLFYIIILPVFSLFVYGLSLFLGALAIYFIDLENIWLFFSRILWFATPIFYSISNPKLIWLNLFNPLYHFITISRDSIIYNTFPETTLILISLIFTTLSLILGILTFTRLQRKFAELV